MQPRDLLAAVVVLAAVSGAHAAEPARERPPVKLLVTVVIDGVSWPRLDQSRPRLREGLQRLLDEGHFFTKSPYRHLRRSGLTTGG